jgi:hypothetical protein
MNQKTNIFVNHHIQRADIKTRVFSLGQALTLSVICVGLNSVTLFTYQTIKEKSATGTEC